MKTGTADSTISTKNGIDSWFLVVGLTFFGLTFFSLPLNLHAISPILKLPPQKAQPSITAEKVKNENGIPLNVENNSLLINPSLTKEFYPNDGDLFLETKNQVKEKVLGLNLLTQHSSHSFTRFIPVQNFSGSVI